MILNWQKGYNTPNNNTNQPALPANLDGLAVETLKHQMKTEQKLEELEKKIDQIAWRNIPKTEENSNPVTENTENKTTQTESSKEIIIPISGKFLSKILPTIEPSKRENIGIFGLRTFDNLPYTTYEDAKFWLTVVASMVPYETFLKNFQAIDNKVYTTNETKTFPFPSFFVNPTRSDTSVRIVIKVESQTLLITLPKSKFSTFKSLILKK